MLSNKLSNSAKILIGIAIYAIAIFSICKFYLQPYLLFAILGSLAVLLFVITPKRRTFYAFLVGMLLGPTTEMICIHFGVWSYTNPQFLGIPIWLPLIWGIASFTTARIAIAFTR